MKVDFFWHNYKYLPYEKKFAERELTSLYGEKPRLTPSGLILDSVNGWRSQALQTTYFSRAAAENGECIVPNQALLESSANGEFRKVGHRNNAPATLARQSTRYSAHGLHEYRGKFNPQVVRAVGNMIGLKQDCWLFDPFCGSGTTLLEALHNNWNAIGIDINPLGVLIARAKLAAMRIPLEQIEARKTRIMNHLQASIASLSFDKSFTSSHIHRIAGDAWEEKLPHFGYLSKWFTNSVLAQLSAIKSEIDKVPEADIRLIFNVILSDSLRVVSLQDPADLRIRRRKDPPPNSPVIPLFLESIASKLSTIFKARHHLAPSKTYQQAMLNDSRECQGVLKCQRLPQDGFDGAITSPPYATALPYVDTQRLSLVFSGLSSPSELRKMETSLIGSREITNSRRIEFEKAIQENPHNLPSECLAMCQRLYNAIDINVDGFRRQNVPALIYKYLVDMSQMFRSVHRIMKPEAPFALVVGQNTTSLGGSPITIDTPALLAKIAEESNFAIQEVISLDTYVRFDRHRANSIRCEKLLLLKA